MSATRKETTFRLEIAVEAQILAPPAAVWARLTNAADFPTWNSTVGRIGGTIAAGQRLEIGVPSAPGRVFKPTVVTFEPPRRMVWQDGFAPMFQGTRTFTLEGPESGPTTFRMEEVFRGMMLPLIKGSLPDMCAVFDRYAADLRDACVG